MAGPVKSRRRKSAARRLGRFLLPVLAAGLVLGMGRARPRPAPVEAPARMPVIRQIDETLDAADLARIEDWRRKLPGRHARRHNFAWAQARIEGLEKSEYFAHSGIQRLGKFSAEVREEIREISLRPKKGRFTVLCVNHNDEVDGPNCFYRNSDTERKILEDMAGRMGDASVRGDVRLYTDLYPCASCRNVMRQFLEVYTNVNLLVLYRDR